MCVFVSLRLVDLNNYSDVAYRFMISNFVSEDLNNYFSVVSFL